MDTIIATIKTVGLLSAKPKAIAEATSLTTKQISKLKSDQDFQSVLLNEGVMIYEYNGHNKYRKKKSGQIFVYDLDPSAISKKLIDEGIVSWPKIDLVPAVTAVN